MEVSGLRGSLNGLFTVVLGNFFRLEAERKNSDVMSTESLQGSELNDR